MSRLARSRRIALALRRLPHRYRRDAQGATAIEFAIISVPFLGLIFGILELALIFFTSSVMTQAMSDTGRLVRVGAFQECGSAKEFKALVCDGMNNLMKCEDNLRIDLVSGSDFQSVTLPVVGMSELDPDDPGKKIETGVYEKTGPSEPVVMRGTFYYPLVLPNVMTRLESIPDSRRHIITVSTAFRTEPFPADAQCSDDMNTRIAELSGGRPGDQS
ncbi:TadE/TadG family type IV pilus assembly protein [uncultured Algimonas sp.]|uniref:TadE/TadG family type IV pilus assembly protein n=1 Tax=uncultured Algimonas sp. TaxID=1547920 RepID=UPI00262E5CB5|nr:TadE/TadG family type IV pilus assembly protein [uncultured Algimonas sp.]